MSEAIEHLPTREGYDRWAAIYDGEDNPLVALEEEHFGRLLGDVAGLDVLDIGCGTGRHALRLARAGARVAALDLSPEMLARARAKLGGDRIDFRVHDLAEPLPFREASFDRVVSALVLDHVGDLERAFGEMARVSRPGGLVFVSVMHPALMLRGVQARFIDPETGRETRPASHPHRISDYLNAALRAGLAIEHVAEHAVGEDLAARLPRAAKYLGWPMLLLLRLAPR